MKGKDSFVYLPFVFLTAGGIFQQPPKNHFLTLVPLQVSEETPKQANSFFCLPGDGRCFFRAVAAALVGFLAVNPVQTEPNGLFGCAVKHLKTLTVPGTESELGSAAELVESADCLRDLIVNKFFDVYPGSFCSCLCSPILSLHLLGEDERKG